jgi:EmrB/QacA subfamily drug resistance transporter
MTDPHYTRRWLVLAAVALAQLMVVLDVTVVNIALPSAQADLGFDDDSRQWVITAYALAFGSLLLLGGRISDLIGRKRTFVAGLLGFAGASAVGGAAPSFEVLVGARAVQGGFAAVLAPAALSLLTTTFTDPDERAKAFGVYGAIGGSGAAFGLLLGGALTQLLEWRWTMYVNLLFAVPAALAAVRLLVNRRPATPPRIDVPGVLVATSGLLALVYGFANAETHGWQAPLTVVLLAYGVVSLAAFVALERRVAHPLLPLAVVRDRNRGAAFLAIGITGLATFAAFLFLTYYLQETLGFSPIQTGLAFLPMVAMVMVTATVASTRLLPRVGPGPLVPAGLALAAVGVGYLTGIDAGSSYAGAVLPGIMASGVGFGMIMAPSFATATHGVADGGAGVASAIMNNS